MPITYTIDAATGTLFVTWQGAVSLQELAQHWDRLFQDEAFATVACALTDLRASTFQFTGGEFWRTIDDHYREAVERKPFKVAILAGSQEHARHVGIWKTLVPKTIQARLFHDREEALRWLGFAESGHGRVT